MFTNFLLVLNLVFLTGCFSKKIEISKEQFNEMMHVFNRSKNGGPMGSTQVFKSDVSDFSCTGSAEKGQCEIKDGAMVLLIDGAIPPGTFSTVYLGEEMAGAGAIKLAKGDTVKYQGKVMISKSGQTFFIDSAELQKK